MIFFILAVLEVFMLYQLGEFFVAKSLRPLECSMVIGIGPTIYKKNNITVKLIPIYVKVHGCETRSVLPVLGGVFLIFVLSVIILFGFNMIDGIPSNGVLHANPGSNLKAGDVITENFGGVVEVKRGDKYLRYVLKEQDQVEFAKTKNPFKVAAYSFKEVVNAAGRSALSLRGSNAFLEVVWYETLLIFIMDLFGWFLRWLGIVKIKAPANPGNQKVTTSDEPSNSEILDEVK